MFIGFKEKRVSVTDAEIYLKIKGNGPPVMLLHGYPQTHMCWHHVAPVLSKSYTVICPDLRGYGASSIPKSDMNHVAYSKRIMGQDMLDVMISLGFSKFYLVGHDRGARVAFRLALDHPDRILKFVSLDVIPTINTWEGISRARSIDAFHWSFLAQPRPFPEKLIANNSSFFFDWLIHNWAAPGFQFNTTAINHYKSAFSRPKSIHAACEDYRAGANLDVQHDLVDRQKKKRLQCPVLCLWGNKRSLSGSMDGLSPIEIWKLWADNVQGGPVDCGHFLPEEAPDDVNHWLHSFLGDA